MSKNSFSTVPGDIPLLLFTSPHVGRLEGMAQNYYTLFLYTIEN
jgi:hypothetical protein